MAAGFARGLKHPRCASSFHPAGVPGLHCGVLTRGRTRPTAEAAGRRQARSPTTAIRDRYPDRPADRGTDGSPRLRRAPEIHPHGAGPQHATARVGDRDPGRRRPLAQRDLRSHRSLAVPRPDQGVRRRRRPCPGLGAHLRPETRTRTVTSRKLAAGAILDPCFEFWCCRWSAGRGARRRRVRGS
jgi:hypothetical protein